MKKSIINLVILVLLFGSTILHAQDGLILAFNLKPNDLTLHRTARPGNPFDKAGRKFAILGDESGSFEAWAYPLKLIRNFTFSFFLGSSTRPIPASDIVRYIDVSPEATTLTYTYQSFTVKATYITPVNEPGAIILLEIDSTEPLSIVCSFLPVLQPMWPAGLGGQYAFWDNNLNAYIISEPTGKNHGIIGSPAASGLSFTPAHMLSDAESEFKITIPNPETVKDKYIPVYLAGGQGKHADILKVYKKLQNNPADLYKKNQETLQIKTPDKQLNLAFEWAKVAFDNLIVDNPLLGKGLVAGLGASGSSGRPGFGWFFGGDTYINSFSLSGYGAFQTVRDILAFTQKWQRKDGKMAHELSQAEGYIDWWNDYHYGYIHGDTTPYYLAAVYDYVRMSGDKEFIIESWDSLKRAFAWCLSTDANGDGLMDNSKAGLGALEYGALIGIESDIYMSAVWVRAAYAMAKLADSVGKKALSAKASEYYKKAKKAFNEKFWDKENQFYAYAFNKKGKHVKEISPWNALGLMWHMGTPERSLKSLEKISSAELTTDWGIRSISKKSSYFQPLNYNYGAVWPFLTSWVTTALFKHHLPLQGSTLLKSTAGHTFEHALGYLTEVFSGTLYAWPQESVSHQGFSTAGVILPLIRGLAGLEGDTFAKTLTFAPHFPADWEHVTLNNYKVGQAVVSFDYKRSKNKIQIDIKPESSKDYSLHLAPALSAGNKIQALHINGNPAEFEISRNAQVIQPEVYIPLKSELIRCEIDFTPSVEILPVILSPRIGDKDQGLKIISLLTKNSSLTLKVEGLSGKEYSIRVLNCELIEKLEGAELDSNKLRFRIPQGKPGEFVGHVVKIKAQKLEKIAGNPVTPHIDSH
jgi:hypothetical protein